MPAPRYNRGMNRPSVIIVSPALAAANNGNWQTARRWQLLLRPYAAVRITSHWPDADAVGDQIMLALHARRSADAIDAWARERPLQSLAVVLTGTDLYRDIEIDARAQHSLELASRLVVLQELGVAALPAGLRRKARVIYQSTPQRRTLPKTQRELRAVMVGHLRDVKSPETLFEAARLLAARRDIRISHIGEAGDRSWEKQARHTERDAPSYRWLGGLPHSQTRQAIQRAHVLIHTSAMEGGAHVIMEAVRSGTPVLASRVAGNVGMLGADYEGYFEHGDAAALCALLEQCRLGQEQTVDDPASALLERLHAQCSLRAPLFTAESEQAALRQLLHELQDRT